MRLSVFNYDDIPPGYYYQAMTTGLPTQRFWHQKKFAAVAERIPDGARVLDFGCGPGSFLSVLREHKPACHAVGVDVASIQLDFASRNFGGDDRLRFERVEPGCGVLPFQTGSFDCATCIEVVEHLHPHLAVRVLQELRRVVKPRGNLILTTPNYRSLWPLIEGGISRFGPVSYHEQHINRFFPRTFRAFLETAGLEVEKLESLFVASPFLAGLSWQLAERLHGAERRHGGMSGSLLLAEARALPWS